MINGRITYIQLSPEAARMTESELSEEITLVSTLARLQAGAGKHVLIAECLTRLGYDRVTVRATLESELSLPSPQTVRGMKARAFAAQRDVYES